MNTNKCLEEMTDPGKFEKLANSILRFSTPDYEPLISLGINSNGETIRGPIDGFWRVPDKLPRHYISVQHTITDPSGLRNKWLSEKPDKLGDLIKAAKCSAKLREEYPDATFTVILSTNQKITSKETISFLSDVYKKADELGVEVDIWTQDNYADYLDCKSEGQYLRKKYLGIDAKMLSPSLLKDLGRESCSQYRNLQLTDPNTWVQRHEEINLVSGLRSNQFKTIFLIGDSGYGKSSLSFRLLEGYLDEGGMGIFMPGDVVANAISLSDALEQLLLKLYPTLQRGESKKLSELLPINEPFIIIIDDISRLSNSDMIIRKVAGWAAPPFVIICPVLSRFRRVVDDTKQLKEAHIVNIDKMTAKEANHAIELIALENKINLSNIDRDNIAIGLNYDPWLIGEFSKQLESGLDPNNCAIKSVEELINRRIEQFIESNPSLLKSACFDVLVSLCLFMLENKNFQPDYEIISEWFDGEEIKIIISLCNLSKLCSISDEGQFHFQHDRLLEYFCIQSIGKNFNKLALNTDLISEPYYAEFIAQSLIQYQQPDNILEKIIEENPLAIITTLRYIVDINTDYHKKLFNLANNWININAKNHSNSTPEYLRGEIAYSLIRTDSSLVLDLPETNFGLQKNWLGWFARLRNGDAKGAINYCKVFGMGLTQDGWLFLELMEHSKMHNLERLLQTFEDQLKPDNDIKEIRARFIIAGFIGQDSLQPKIAEFWDSAQKKDDILFEAIWAALRCSSDHQQDQFLCSLINEWSKKDDQDTFRFSHLCNLLNLFPDESIVNFLIQKGDECENLKIRVAEICGNINLPKALEYAVRICAQADIHDRLSFSVTNWENEYSSALSNNCITHLKKLWSDNKNCYSVREVAFNIWLKNHNLNSINLIETISEINPDEPIFDEAIRERARLGDQTCVHHLVNKLIEDPLYFSVAHSVWCSDVKKVTKKYLANFSSIPNDFSGGNLDIHYQIAFLLRDIPDEDAEALLVEYWECLQFSPLFIHAAIYTGTQHCIEIVRKSIQKCPDKIDLFKFIAQFYGVSGYRITLLLPSRLPSIEFRRIKNIEPFIEYLDDSALHSFAAACYLLGDDAIEWCWSNLPKDINDYYRRGYCPTNDDILELLENLYHKHPNHIYELLEKLEKLDYSQDEIIGFLQKWMQEEINIDKLRIISEFIIQIGKRKHISMLEVAPFDTPIYQRTLEYIKENTEYAVKRRTLE